MSTVKTSTNEYKVYMQYDTEEIDGDVIYTGDTTCKILLNNELVAFGHSSCNDGINLLNLLVGRFPLLGH